MNRKIASLSALLILSSASLASANSTVEFRSAAFFPTSSHYRDIYGSVGPDFEIEWSTCLCCVETWANLTWYPACGHVSSCGKTGLNVVNFSFGLKKSCQICDCFYIYGGIGPVLGGAWVNNKIKCCSNCSRSNERDSAFAVGGIIKSGFYYYLTCNFFVDLFVDYFYDYAFFHRGVNVGGLRTGLGLGMAF